MRKLLLAIGVWSAAASGVALGQAVLDRPFPNYLGFTLQQFNMIVAGTAADPLSGQYRNLVIGEDKNGNKSLCGYVNFRNAQGGYDPFYAFGFAGGDQPKAYVSHFALGEQIGAAPDLEFLGCLAALAR